MATGTIKAVASKEDLGAVKDSIQYATNRFEPSTLEELETGLDTLASSMELGEVTAIKIVTTYFSLDEVFYSGVTYQGYMHKMASSTFSCFLSSNGYGSSFVIGRSTNGWNFNKTVGYLDSSFKATRSAIAIIADGNTHIAVSTGEYLYIKNHNSLSEGLYIATASIAQNGTLSSSNVTAITRGIGGQVTELNNKVGKIASAGKGATNTSTGKCTFTMPLDSQGMVFVGSTSQIYCLMQGNGTFSHSDTASGYTISASGTTVTLTKTTSVSSSVAISWFFITR